MDYDDTLVLNGPIGYTNSIIFDSIDANMIRKIAFRMKGSAGPSALDAEQWWRILGTKLFGSVGSDLCQSVANLTKKLATTLINDMNSISPLMACRLIPLDKNPGLRPIGIGEVLRRITGKAVLSVLRKDVENAAGGLQLCAGQKAGCEAGIHAMVEIFQDENVHGIIQVDASNAFNRINRKVMLKNLEVICPELAIYGKTVMALRRDYLSLEV